jgi:hypothetical protein
MFVSRDGSGVQEHIPSTSDGHKLECLNSSVSTRVLIHSEDILVMRVYVLTFINKQLLMFYFVTS